MIKLRMLWVCVALLSVSLIRSEDDCCEDKSGSIQERMRAIDVSIALKKYEQIQTEKAKTEVALIMMGEHEKISDEMNMMHQRVLWLQKNAEDIKRQLLDLGKAVAVASSK